MNDLPDSPIVVRFTTDAKMLYDVQAALAYASRYKWEKLQMALVVGAVIVGVVEAAISNGKWFTFDREIHWIFAISIATMVLRALYLKWRAPRVLKTTPAFQGPRTYSFSSENFLYDSELTQSTMQRTEQPEGVRRGVAP